MKTIILILVIGVFPLLLLIFHLIAARNRRLFLNATERMDDERFAAALGRTGDLGGLCCHVRRHIAAQANVPAERLHPEHNMHDIASMYMFDWDNSVVLFAIDEYLAEHGLDNRTSVKLESHMQLDELLLEDGITLAGYISYIADAVEVACTSLPAPDGEAQEG